ncbi:hypothetical protein L3X38_021861 [Prunus dulcis]|uniref:Ribosomal protein L34 n=1 Tax=Prunus dulcis TaxID=3755 RepID=A0AAD4Z3S1_PRUDU|nr:hypothetical protein L3X38_021861 [Prunus dulcis]
MGRSSPERYQSTWKGPIQTSCAGALDKAKGRKTSSSSLGITQKERTEDEEEEEKEGGGKRMASITAMSLSPCLSSRGIQQAFTPSASLTFLTGSRTRKSSVSLNAATPRSSLLHCSFVPSSSLSFPSSFSGLSLGLDLSSSIGVGRRRGSGFVVRAGKAALCLTKRNRSRKSLARTHGFRRRMRTTGGRAILSDLVKSTLASTRWGIFTTNNSISA